MRPEGGAPRHRRPAHWRRRFAVNGAPRLHELRRRPARALKGAGTSRTAVTPGRCGGGGNKCWRAARISCGRR